MAELLPLVSITFLCGGAEAALRPGATPKAGRLTVVWTFPLSSSVIVRCEVQSSILMKWRTSSAHFNCQRVSNG